MHEINIKNNIDFDKILSCKECNKLFTITNINDMYVYNCNCLLLLITYKCYNDILTLININFKINYNNDCYHLSYYPYIPNSNYNPHINKTNTFSLTKYDQKESQRINDECREKQKIAIILKKKYIPETLPNILSNNHHDYLLL